jgi:TrmH family RNA methyltransferase
VRRDDEVISSPQNPRVKAVAKLVKDRRERDRTGLFVAEGSTELRRVREAGYEIIDHFGTDVGIPVTQAAMDRMAYRAGCDELAVVVQKPHDLASLPGGNGVYLVTVGVEKPGNLGAMARTAAAAGCRGLVAAGPAVDVYNPNALRNAAGGLYALPVAVASDEEVLDWLRTNGVTIAATTPDRDATNLHAFAPPPRIAYVIGPEHAGLDDAWLTAADVRLRVPTVPGPVDSLNASATAAVVLFASQRADDDVHHEARP